MIYQLLLLFITLCSAEKSRMASDFSWFPWDKDEFYIHPFFAMLLCSIVFVILLIPCLVMADARVVKEYKEQQALLAAKERSKKN